ncbi:MAG: rRNA maturation RNase YbeY [Xenococcaceae cyanobacterium]
MPPSTTPTVIVEVNLQDVFFPNSSTANPDAARNCPIAPATWKSWFQTWLETLYPDIPEADAYELSLRLTDDLEIQTLNAKYRDKNQPTDVLAFAELEVEVPKLSDEWGESEPLYLGDIVISVDTASLQAEQQGHSLPTELAWLAAHGLLHLLGWDHPDEDSLIEMLSQQEILLKVVHVNQIFSTMRSGNDGEQSVL